MRLVALGIALVFGLGWGAPREAYGDGPLSWGDRRAASASFVGIRGDQLRFATPEGESAISPDQFVHWSDGGLPRPRQFLVTRGGDVLAFDEATLDETTWTIQSPHFGERSGEISDLRAIVWRSWGGESPWLRRAVAPPGGVELVALSGDRTTGDAAEAFGELVSLRLGDEYVDVDLDRVAELRFGDPKFDADGPQHTDSPKWLLGLSDGSLLAAKSLHGDGDRLTATALSLGDVSLAVDDVSLLQNLDGEFRYLSDEAPQGYRHEPRLGVARELGVDCNVLGGLATVRGVPYLRLLGFASGSRVAYNLTGEAAASRLFAEVALDDAAGDAGSAVVRVFARKGGGWTERYASDVVVGGRPPIPLAVDLAGATAAAIVVEYADRGDVLDRVDLLNARFVPATPR